eukprot:jgi/Botrbrau1/15241/Bobra.0149s0093.3
MWFCGSTLASPPWACSVRGRSTWSSDSSALRQHFGAWDGLRSAEDVNSQSPVSPDVDLPVRNRTWVKEALPVVYHELYSAPILPEGHRFPMPVFRRIYQLLIEDGIVQEHQVHRPPLFKNDDLILLVHDREYVERFSKGALDPVRIRQIGFGQVTSQPDLIARTKAEVGGTLYTARLALRHGLAVNTAGGTHHAFPAHGSGFCILNDLAICAETLLAEGVVSRVLIFDLDVHQGDGTAFIFTGRSDVYTVSVHAASNFPARKQCSHLDVPLPDRLGDEAYLGIVGTVLTDTLRSFKPDLVLYDAGVDVHTEDSLGNLSITDVGLQRREYLVLDTCMGFGVPVAGFVGGGYSPDLDVLARRHCWLHRAAHELWSAYELG